MSVDLRDVTGIDFDGHFLYIRIFFSGGHVSAWAVSSAGGLESAWRECKAKAREARIAE